MNLIWGGCSLINLKNNRYGIFIYKKSHMPDVFFLAKGNVNFKMYEEISEKNYERLK